MHKKLFASALINILLAGATSATPVYAGTKGAPFYLIKGGVFSGHGDSTDDVVKAGGGCTVTKKLCAPWVDLPAWPTAPGGLAIAIGAGGHFHKQYVEDKGVGLLWDQELNLIAGDDKAATFITYSSLTCGIGFATGTLVLAHKAQTPALLKVHGMPVKDNVHYTFQYLRLGVTGVIVATNNKKTDVIVAALTIHPKEPTAATIARCIGLPPGPPLKVSFDVLGIAI